METKQGPNGPLPSNCSQASKALRRGNPRTARLTPRVTAPSAVPPRLGPPISHLPLTPSPAVPHTPRGLGRLFLSVLFPSHPTHASSLLSEPPTSLRLHRKNHHHSFPFTPRNASALRLPPPAKSQFLHFPNRAAATPRALPLGGSKAKQIIVEREEQEQRPGPSFVSVRNWRDH